MEGKTGTTEAQETARLAGLRIEAVLRRERELGVPPVNADAMRKTAERIRRRPMLYDQGQFLGGLERPGKPVEECMSACCVAGWACIAGGENITGPTPQRLSATSQEETARAVLQLTEAESDLLFAGRWPASWLVDCGAVTEEEARTRQVSGRIRPEAGEAAAFLEYAADECVNLPEPRTV